MLNQNLSESLLDLLRQNFGKPLLSEDITKLLKISSQAITKQIQGLRKRGFVIESLEDQSYLLKQIPDCLAPKDIHTYLKTNFIGQDMHYFAELSSETQTAFSLAQKYPQAEESITPLRLSPQLPSPDQNPYAGNGSVIVTEVATSEVSLWSTTTSGINLHAAVVLRPGILPIRAPQIALVAHVALARVIDNMSGVKPILRWPNELTANNKAVARIKATMESNIDKINFLVLSFEVNLNGLPEELSHPLNNNVTSLRQLSGKPINRPAFAAALFRELEKWYVTYINKGPEKIVREINQFCKFGNKGTEIIVDGKTYTGVVEGLDVDGTLLLRSATGHLQRIAPGNISQTP